jgi:photosystem II stability/assembly factor-like uncharacterized protein
VLPNVAPSTMRHLRFSVVPATILVSSALLVSPTFAAQEPDASSDSVATEEVEEAKPKKPSKKGLPVRVEGALPLEWVDALHWRSVGPANMGGRVTDYAVNPDDPSEYWVGLATGGILHTTNNGVKYEHQFTNQRTASIGNLCVAPSNPQVIWAGTGECNPRNSVSWGNGIYKSTDSGATWFHMGLEDTFQIGEVLVHPEDENTVYVGALGRLWGASDERGLYKTTDGGENWERVLFVDDNTGVIEIGFQPGDPNTMLVATYDRQRDDFDSNDPARKWGEGSALWRSTDGGGSFERLTGEDKSNGLPTVKLGRIGLDWSVSEPNVVLAVIETEMISQEPENAAYLGVTAENAEVGARLTSITEDSPAEAAGLKEGDIVLRLAGETVVSWTAMQTMLRKRFADETSYVEIIRDGEALEIEVSFSRRPDQEEDNTDFLGYPNPGPFRGTLGGQRGGAPDQQGANGHDFGGVYRSEDAGITWARINTLNPRPMYYSEIRIDPSNGKHVFLLGTSLYRSFDGGETFTGDGLAGGVHVDNHALWIDPADGEHIMLGCDGGIYVTYDRMEAWDHHNHIAIGQFYNVAAGPRADYRVYGGLQDNGTWGAPQMVRWGRGPVNGDWMSIGGGDGFVVRIDPTDPDLVYSESQNAGMGRRHLVTGERGFIRPSAERGRRLRWNWNTPFILSNFNAGIFYSAGSHVFRSIKHGEDAARISPDVCATDRGSATSIAESFFDPDVVYVGTDDGSMMVTKDGGLTWIDLWNPAADPIRTIEAEKAQEEAEAAAEKAAKEAEEAAAEALAADPDAVEPDVVETDAEVVEIPTIEIAREPVVTDTTDEAEAAPAADVVTGMWDCVASGDGIDEDDEGKFTLDLELGESGAVTGEIKSPIGDGEIRDGRYDAAKGTLRFAFVQDTFRIDFELEIDGDEMGGTLNGAGGSFHFTTKGKRRPKDEPGKIIDEVATVPLLFQDEEGTEVADHDEAPNEPEEEVQDEIIEEVVEVGREIPDDCLEALLPGRTYVSQIYPSHHKRGRVYAAFDGHRQNDDEPRLFASDDNGKSWASLTKSLSKAVGSIRTVQEDITNSEVLYIGCEFGCYVTIDRGASWTRLNGNLPTVPVHDFAQHPTSGELIAGTHGRSIWILDVSALRQATNEIIDAKAHLFTPKTAYQWKSLPRRATTTMRAFVGENPATGAQLTYSLDKRARDIALRIEDHAGNTIREFEPSGDKGLHVVNWDLRGAPPQADQNSGRRRRRRGRLMEPGTYRVVLDVDGTTHAASVNVRMDPVFPDPNWVQTEEEAALVEELLETSDEDGGNNEDVRDS